MGAGILPVALYKKKIYFLYSRESVDIKSRDSGKWSDFGGASDKDETPKQTAIRECWEETSGILGSQHKIKKLLKDHLLDKIYHKGYTTFIVLIPYDASLPKKLEMKYKTALKMEPEKVFAHNGFYEKDKAAWIPLSDLKKRINTFRVWYKSIVYKTINLFN